MKDVYLIIVVAVATLFSVTTADNNLEDGVPTAKLISTFQIVRFPNEACTGSTATRNGTCYTSAECSDKGGSTSGSCADGFGVCCIFTITECGKSSSENITYWDAPATVAAGSCNLEINPINDNICQLRLDFLTFVITGPSTTSLCEIALFANMPGGAIANTNDAAFTAAKNNQASWETNCLTDSFSVSSPNPANKPNVLCGTNSGVHMYVDMDSEHSNVLSFIFQTLAAGLSTTMTTRGQTTLANRDWDITIMQYECGYINSAPPGCTQYFWSDTGTGGGWIESYNFVAAATSKHLANQNQKVCIRREKTICWAAFYLHITGSAFDISGGTKGSLADSPLAFSAQGQPCGYAGVTGNGLGDEDKPNAYDCVIIPGLFAVAGATGLVNGAATPAIVRLGIAIATNHAPAGPQIGGHDIFGVNTSTNGITPVAGTAAPHTLFTQHVPFTVIFKSDGFEGVGDDGDNSLLNYGTGVRLNYDLIPCTA